MSNRLDRQYQNLLKTILDFGVVKSDRTGTGTKSIFGYTIRHDMSDGFPLLTTKKMAWKTMVTELLWFLKGDTNIKYLVDNDCNIWNGDAYKNYKLKNNFQINQGIDILSQEEFINQIKTYSDFAEVYGELGPIYGKQWRRWRKAIDNPETGYQDFIYVDQIQNLINDLKTNPDSRRLMVSAWNVGELDQMVLPPCHYGFQVYTRGLSLEERRSLVTQEMFNQIYNGGGPESLSHREINQWNVPTRAISLMWNQRSVDTFLGLPFNIASYGLLLEIIAKEVNMVPDQLIGNLGDVHLYLNHIEQAKEQIGREYTPEERTQMLKEAMGEEFYKTTLSELMPFGGGLYEYYIQHKIPRRTREPFELPKLIINDEFWNPDTSIINQINYINPDDFIIDKYQSHPTIKAPLSN